ncbi:MAG: hypothetical protein H6746_13040 [Deltaproteobacteria bacterium]|nr:hypothetical protein [Deltaproteobacteria bacterium]
MHRCRIALAFALVLALTSAITACEPIEDTDGSGAADVSTADARGDALADALGPDAGWPPAIDPASDTQLGTTEAGTLSFFDGQVLLTLQAGSLDTDTSITMTRSIIQASGKDWVGYTFGDHGIPLDPRGELTLTVPVAWLPAGAAVNPTLGIYRLDGVRLGAQLQTASSSVSGGRFTITVSIESLDDFVLATNP